MLAAFQRQYALLQASRLEKSRGLGLNRDFMGFLHGLYNGMINKYK
jgi:hypothetical protein